MQKGPFPAYLCRIVKYSVIKSDVIKRFDCNRIRFAGFLSQANLVLLPSFFMNFALLCKLS